MSITLTFFVATLISVVCTGLTSCSSDEANDLRKKKEITKDIKAAENKVAEASKQNAGTEEFTEATQELMVYLLEFYHSYPKDSYAPECVTKVHMLHSALGNTMKAVAYGDTLLNQYPKYENRAQVIESQIQAYEMMIEPRDVTKIKGYLEMWLAENKKASKQKIEDMEYHLKYVGMSLENRMKMNMEELD